MTGKLEARFPVGTGGGGSGVRDMVPLSLGNLGVKFSETSFLLFKTYILPKSVVVIFRQHFTTFNSNNLALSSMFSFQSAWGRK